jgi:hypothetical protein
MDVAMWKEVAKEKCSQTKASRENRENKEEMHTAIKSNG